MLCSSINRRQIDGWLYAFLILSVGVAGCAKQDSRAKVVPVTGRVFLDEQPLEFGTVTFQPSRGQPARGTIQSDGRFELTTYEDGDGAAVGEHKIRVTAYEIEDPNAEPQEASSDSLGRLVTPEKYSRFPSSELTALVVESGNAPFILRLQTPPPEDPVDDEEAATDTEPATEAETSEERPPEDNAEEADSEESVSQEELETAPQQPGD